MILCPALPRVSGLSRQESRNFLNFQNWLLASIRHGKHLVPPAAL